MIDERITIAILISAFSLVAAIWDFRTRRLPNWLTVSGFVAALLTHVWFGGWAGLFQSLQGAAFGFGIMFVLWIIGGGGGGDVKLMTAVGAWLGFRSTALVFVGSVVVAVILSLGAGMYQWMGRVTAAAPAGAPIPSRKNWRLVPYAVPVAVATWVLQLGMLLLHAGPRGI